MSVTLIGILGVVGLLALIFARVPIALSLAVSGLAGYAALDGWAKALKMFGSVPCNLASAYSLSVIPLFIHMPESAALRHMANKDDDAYNAGFIDMQVALDTAPIAV